MKRLVILLLLLLLPAAMVRASDFGDARLSYIKGDVLIFSEEAEDWVPAAANTPLGEDDRIWVPRDGRAEITLTGGVYLRLDEETALDIIALEEDDWQFYLAKGRLYVNNRQGGIDHIQIDTPRTSVSNYDNSIIILDTNTNGLLVLSALKGYTQVETERGITRVDAGRSLKIFNDLTGETAPLPEPDSWERWNHRRDNKLLAARESIRYLPDELDDSAPVLEEHGTWFFTADYGYVWQPRISLTIDWAPYREGRWAWRFGTYTWISYEPWGWAPYHYGRWAHLGGRGWCWVPPHRHEVVWAPGYVAWVEYDNHVAWVPLAPGEPFYGHIPRRHHQHQPPPRTITRTVYRNITINNAITVVNRQTFLTGRKEKVTLRGNPFLSREGSTRTPAIKPVRESAAPTVRPVPPGRKPPEKVIRTTPKQVREERKLRRSERESVLKKTTPATELPVVNRPAPRPLPREERMQQRREHAEKNKQRSRTAPDPGPVTAPSASPVKERKEIRQQESQEGRRPETGKRAPLVAPMVRERAQHPGVHPDGIRAPERQGKHPKTKDIPPKTDRPGPAQEQQTPQDKKERLPRPGTPEADKQ